MDGPSRASSALSGFLDHIAEAGISDQQRAYMKTRGRCAECGRRAGYRARGTVVSATGEPLSTFRMSTPQGAIVRCPHCDASWPYYASEGEISAPPSITTEVVETEVVIDEAAQPPIPFDNRGGTSSYEVTRTFTAEWSQTCEVQREQTDTTGQNSSFGLDTMVKLDASIERAVKTAYSVTETKRETKTDEVRFEVPARVCRNLCIVHRRMWQHGLVRVSRSDSDVDSGSQIDVPFRVLTNVEIGYGFRDEE